MKIATIEGINTSLIGNVPEKRYIKYTNLTEGELQLALLQRQLELVQSLTGKDYRPEIDILSNVAEKGINQKISIGSTTTLDIFQFVNNAARQQQPAAFGSSIGTAGTSREQYDACLNNVKNQYSGLAWRLKTARKKDELFAAAGCNGFLTMEAVLNANLELAGNASLYAGFLPAAAAIQNNVVFAKRNIQKFHAQSLSEISGLSIENINGFWRNGVLAALAEQPESILNKLAGQNIASSYGDDLMKRSQQNAQQAAQANEKTDFSGIITAITKGIESIKKIFDSLRDNGFGEKLQGVITPSRSTAPDPDDFTTKGGENGGKNTENDFWNTELLTGVPNKILVPTAGLAATALIYYSFNNK